MNPPNGADLPACPDTGRASSETGARAPTTTTTTAVLPIEQFIWGASQASFIWEDAETSDEATVTSASEPSGETDLPRIVVLADDDDEDEALEPDDDWRRQLISALQDSDREKSSPPPLPEPEGAPPLPYVPPAQRLPPRTFVRPTRIAPPAPIERAPRNRAGISLLGVSAAAGLLAAALPQSTNMPDSAIAASPPLAFTSVHAKVPTEDSGTFKPVMFNSPVLVREVGAPPASPASAQQPAIEMVRTVPVQLGREAQAAQSPTVVETRAADLPPEPTLTLKPELAPETTPPSHDRNNFAALTTEPPAPPPQMLAPPAQASVLPSAPSAPERTAAISPSPDTAPQQTPTAAPPAAQEPKAATEPPPASSSARRAPQTSTASESTDRKPPRKATRAKTKTASKTGTSKTGTKTTTKTKAAPTKTAARAPDPKWETRRQGLRTAPPAEEPSTVTKFLKSLWPFSSGDDAAATKGNVPQRRSEAPQPARTQNSAWSGEKDR